HLTAIKELIPILSQSKMLSKVKSELNILETLLEGAFLIGEITPKLSDKIVSYGELLSSYIISEYFIAEGLDIVHIDSREVIKTNLVLGKTSVNYELTNNNCKKVVENNGNKVLVVGRSEERRVGKQGSSSWAEDGE